MINHKTYHAAHRCLPDQAWQDCAVRWDRGDFESLWWARTLQDPRGTYEHDAEYKELYNIH